MLFQDCEAQEDDALSEKILEEFLEDPPPSVLLVLM